MAEGINYIIGNSLVNELEDKKLARMLKPLKEKQADQTLNSTINEDDAIKAKTNLLVQAIYDKYVPNLEQIATKMK